MKPTPGRPVFTALLIPFCFGCVAVRAQVQVWLTSPQETARFEQQKPSLSFTDAPGRSPTIEVDETRRFQTMDGFGFCLTGGSATHLMRMSSSDRTALLQELFATDGTNIGTSYLRLTMGASDLNDRVYSYDDLPPGETDPELAKFSLAPDRPEVLPVLKEILAIAPELKLLASPWSPPAWMKTNHDTVGGQLDPKFYPSYAKYFVKYLQAMQAEGVRIDAVTVQNEPLNPKNNPSLFMPAHEQADFIKHHLGPAFAASAIHTKIVLYDHNADRPDYPMSILQDADASRFVDGSAFHLYRGQIQALAKVHDVFPQKNLYFTEQWVNAPGNLRADLDWHTQMLTIGASRNWCRTVLEWNLTSNPSLTPYTDRGGCTRCLGAVTIDGDRVVRNPAYYIIAHAAKFVRPGSVRIDSTDVHALPNVAFRSPAGQTVLIVLNPGAVSQDFDILWHGRKCHSSLREGAVGTFVW